MCRYTSLALGSYLLHIKLYKLYEHLNTEIALTGDETKQAFWFHLYANVTGPAVLVHICSHSLPVYPFHVLVMTKKKFQHQVLFDEIHFRGWSVLRIIFRNNRILFLKKKKNFVHLILIKTGLNSFGFSCCSRQCLYTCFKDRRWMLPCVFVLINEDNRATHLFSHLWLQQERS